MTNHLLNLPSGPAGVKIAAEAWGGAWSGDRRARLDVNEALSTSDTFQRASGQVFAAELMRAYDAAPKVWGQYASRTVVNDFRPKKIIDLFGGRSGLDPVPELSEYPARQANRTEYEVQVRKFGARFAWSWEASVNDELDEFSRYPTALATAAAEEESRQAAGLLVTKSGINTAFFKSGNKNAPDTAPLTREALTAAYQKVSALRDADGRPISTQGFVLVVPQALALQASAILDARETRITGADGAVTVLNGSQLSGRISLVVDPWLDVVNESAKAATTWFLLPAPAAQRTLTVAFLRGEETPELRVKSDTGQRVGGGTIAPEKGSFDVDDVQYRVRHTIGAAHLDPAGTYASAGA